MTKKSAAPAPGQLANTRQSFYKMVRTSGINDPEAIAASESWRPD